MRGVVFLIMVIFFAGCGGGDTKMVIKDLNNTKWQWLDIAYSNGETLKAPNDKSNFEFKDGKVNIFIDCNRAFAAYKSSENEIKINPIASTRKFCKDSVEQKFFTEFQKAKRYAIKDGIIQFDTSSYNTIRAIQIKQE
jgi:heat shock protein HslJ